MCDSWWEAEKEWHRSWKNNFPPLWQEFFMLDIYTGEKHIADVRTDQGLVIEFQHSPINSEERIAREKFYNDMVWVVDGTRPIHDYPASLRDKTGYTLPANLEFSMFTIRINVFLLHGSAVQCLSFLIF